MGETPQPSWFYPLKGPEILQPSWTESGWGEEMVLQREREGRKKLHNRRFLRIQFSFLFSFIVKHQIKTKAVSKRAKKKKKRQSFIKYNFLFRNSKDI